MAMQRELDGADRSLLQLLQRDATLSTERLAEKTGISKTAAWNRIQKMQRDGVILRQVVIVDPQQVGLHETFFIAIKTNEHNQKWLTKFNAVINRFPEIVEAHRLSGEIDYMLKVQIASTRAFDELYKRIVADVNLFSVTSSLSMEVLKHETSLPLP